MGSRWIDKPLAELGQALRSGEVLAVDLFEQAREAHEKFGDALCAYRVWDEERAVSSVDAGDPALRRRISQALAKLTRRQREAFVLVHFEGFTVRETGSLLGAPEGTVKSHLHRALKALRIELADLQDGIGRSQS